MHSDAYGILKERGGCFWCHLAFISLVASLTRKHVCSTRELRHVASGDCEHGLSIIRFGNVLQLIGEPRFFSSSFSKLLTILLNSNNKSEDRSLLGTMSKGSLPRSTQCYRPRSRGVEFAQSTGISRLINYPEYVRNFLWGLNSGGSCLWSSPTGFPLPGLILILWH